MKKVFLVAALAIALLIAACAPAPTPAPTAVPTATANPSRVASQPASPAASLRPTASPVTATPQTPTSPIVAPTEVPLPSWVTGTNPRPKTDGTKIFGTATSAINTWSITVQAGKYAGTTTGQCTIVKEVTEASSGSVLVGCDAGATWEIWKLP